LKEIPFPPVPFVCSFVRKEKAKQEKKLSAFEPGGEVGTGKKILSTMTFPQLDVTGGVNENERKR